jgi:cytochrome o ubiquinol oxidase operon protein cyoD
MTTLRAYSLGFILSLALTVAAFWLAGERVFEREFLIAALIALAVIQLLVQLICFLHLGREPRPRWNAIMFAFAVFTVVVLVGGTIWIMNHLTHTQDINEIYPSGEITPQAQDD